MKINIRQFRESDVPYKVKWINDERNNKYLHYDLPLREDKTYQWLESIKDRNDREDFTIVINEEPVGLIGLLNIDKKNRKAEFYICLGEEKYKGKGIAFTATDLLIRHAYEQHKLIKIYLFTEVENLQAQNLFEKVGFEKEGLLKKDLIYNEKLIDRYIYGLDIEQYVSNNKVVLSGN